MEHNSVGYRIVSEPNTLKHYGTLGMRWGVRKDLKTGNGAYGQKLRKKVLKSERRSRSAARKFARKPGSKARMNAVTKANKKTNRAIKNVQTYLQIMQRHQTLEANRIARERALDARRRQRVLSRYGY